MANLAVFVFVLSATLFILSLRFLSEVKTSRYGNMAGAAGMVLAVIATLMAFSIERYDLLIGAIVVGAVIGVPLAILMPMTAVPQRTAVSHAFGSLAAAMVGTAEYLQRRPEGIDVFTMSVLGAEMILGYLTFTGSVVAFGKLQEMLPGKPLVYPGKNLVSLAVFAVAAIAAVILVINPTMTIALYVLIAAALIFGILLVSGIGGADMPTVIAILNAYAGLSSAALGFVLDSKLLIVAGALDGSSGLILAILMSKAMNRSFFNVLFGGVGAVAASKDDNEKVYGGKIKSTTAEEIGMLLDSAQRVIIVPGYGLAVAQAQHAVRDIMRQLEARGIEVLFGIHPVAGRMPGHMNVLMAEADVSYEKLKEMEEVNNMFEETDVVIVIGANDTVNPAARAVGSGNPLAGMPILNVDKARTVVVIKRSLSPGFAGIPNPLFAGENSLMFFSDAKEGAIQIVNALKATAPAAKK